MAAIITAHAAVADDGKPDTHSIHAAAIDAYAAGGGVVAKAVITTVLIQMSAIGPATAATLFGTGPNLATNPSFEISADGTTLPADWHGDRKVYLRDTTTVHTGKASLKYVNRDPANYRLCSQPIPLIPGHKYRFSARIRTEAIQGNESGATLCVEWGDERGQWLGGSYPPGLKGSRDWQLVEGVAAVPTNAGACTLSCYVRKGMTGTAWFDTIAVQRVVAPPMRTALIKPGYRGRVYASGDQQACVRVWLNTEDHDFDPQHTSLAVRITGKEEDGASADATLSTPNLTSPINIPVSLHTLSPGEHSLQVRLLGPGGEVRQTENHRITRMDPDFKPRVFIDAHQRCIVDGKPFFPLGMYWSSIKADELAVYADSAFNCLMPYGRPTREQLDLAHCHGLKVIYSVKDLYHGSRWCPSFVTSPAEEDVQLRKFVRDFRDHPALLAWYLNDELPLTYLDRLAAHQRWVEEEDPHHPTWVVLYQYRQVRDYLDTFDVIGTDPYPIGRKSASEAAAWTAETVRQVCGARPVWQVPQLHNWINYKNGDGQSDSYHTPTRDEVRSMAWQCICEGAKGLVFYSWYDVQRNPDVSFDAQWSYLREIAAEIDAATPALLSVEPCPPVAVSAFPAAPVWLHWLLRRHGDTLYLFAVNNGDADGTLTADLPDGWRLVKAVDGADTLKMTGDGFLDRLEKLKVRIYRITQ